LRRHPEQDEQVLSNLKDPHKCIRQVALLAPMILEHLKRLCR
jgi:hypothetical protein